MKISTYEEVTAYLDWSIRDSMKHFIGQPYEADTTIAAVLDFIRRIEGSVFRDPFYYVGNLRIDPRTIRLTDDGYVTVDAWEDTVPPPYRFTVTVDAATGQSTVTLP